MEESISKNEVKNIMAQELKEMLGKDGSEVLLLDVREERELTGELGHIEGIVHIPIGSLAFRLSELQNYKDKNIVIICRSGRRATTGAQILNNAGFVNVSVLKGGMLSWNKYN